MKTTIELDLSTWSTLALEKVRADIDSELERRLKDVGLFPGMTTDERELARTGNRIASIGLVKERMDCDLHRAKAIVEWWFPRAKTT